MNLGVPEMLFIFVLALIIFCPKKLPEIARQIGNALSEIKSATNQAKWQLESEVRKLEVEVQNAVPPVITAASDLVSKGPAAVFTDALAGNLSPAIRLQRLVLGAPQSHTTSPEAQTAVAVQATNSGESRGTAATWQPVPADEQASN